MKVKIMRHIKYILIFIVGLVTYSCVENEYELLDSSSSGFWVELWPESYVEATKDLNLNTLVYDSVNVAIRFNIPELTSDFAAIELHKIVIDPDGNEIEDFIYASFARESLPVDTSYLAESVEELYAGLEFKADSMKPEYSIKFKASMLLRDGSVIEYVSGEYSLVPSLNGFCPLPILPNGDWLAKNIDSQFTKTVEIATPSPFVDEDDGRIWISDFGLDWAWDDRWYALEFKLKCPRGDDPRYVVEILSSDLYESDYSVTGTGPAGDEETKDVRLVPFYYNDDNITAYYDADKQEISFENVPIAESWWSNSWTVNLSFTYISK